MLETARAQDMPIRSRIRSRSAFCDREEDRDRDLGDHVAKSELDTRLRGPTFDPILDLAHATAGVGRQAIVNFGQQARRGGH
jgi:hypothetical protein